MNKYLKLFISWMLESKLYIGHLSSIILGIIAISNGVLKEGVIFISWGAVLWIIEGLYIGYRKNGYKHKRYKRIHANVIIRNFNISLLNSDIKMDRKYKKIYRDLKKLFKNINLYKTSKYIHIAYQTHNSYMDMYLYKDSNKLEMSGSGDINKTSLWKRMGLFESKYHLTSEDGNNLYKWYIKNVLI